jgi:carboxyl-terminal processing protease
MEALAEVMLLVRQRYVEEKTYPQLMHGALNGMLQSLDPHSGFLDEPQLRDMHDDTTGKFGGVGIQIGIKKGMLMIIAPIEDTPGFRAGLMSGDYIEEIDGQKTTGMTMGDAVNKMRGDKGTEVTLTIRRQGDEGPRQVKIVRDEIKVASVKGVRMLDDAIGYIRITQFAQPTADMLENGITNLLAQGMQGLVLDLRSNPGGLLNSAIDVASKFLKPDELIVTTRGRPGVQNEERGTSRGRTHYTNFPMVVLVNWGSASASEIVAGALQDQRRAALVGETTFGKASVQSLIPLASAGKCAIRLTVAQYFTPSGRQIHDKGIDPDIPVYVTPEEWRRVQIRRAQVETPDAFAEQEKKEFVEVVDRVLQRAVDLLRALRAFR